MFRSVRGQRASWNCLREPFRSQFSSRIQVPGAGILKKILKEQGSEKREDKNKKQQGEWARKLCNCPGQLTCLCWMFTLSWRCFSWVVCFHLKAPNALELLLHGVKTGCSPYLLVQLMCAFSKSKMVWIIGKVLYHEQGETYWPAQHQTPDSNSGQHQII